MRTTVGSAMNQAYASGDAKRARQLLENLARSLERGHPSAAASLREGLAESLTVMRLDLPQSLERVLSSTNLIENLFSRVPRDGATSAALAGWHDDPALDRGRCAGSGAPLPQNSRPPHTGQTGRRAARARRGARSWS